MRIDNFFLLIFFAFRPFLIFLFLKRLVKINVSNLILIFLVFNFMLDIRIIYWWIYNSTLDSAEINSLCSWIPSLLSIIFIETLCLLWNNCCSFFRRLKILEVVIILNSRYAVCLLKIWLVLLERFLTNNYWVVAIVYAACLFNNGLRATEISFVLLFFILPFLHPRTRFWDIVQMSIVGFLCCQLLIVHLWNLDDWEFRIVSHGSVRSSINVCVLQFSVISS